MSSSADQDSAPGQPRKSGRKLLAFVPLIAFAVLAVIFFTQLMSGRGCLGSAFSTDRYEISGP